MMALRKSPRKIHWMKRHQQAAKQQRMRWPMMRGDRNELRVVVTLDLHACRQRAIGVDLVQLGLDATTSLVCMVRFITTMAVTTSLSLSRPAMPERGAKPIFVFATSLTCTGTPLICVRTILSMSSRLGSGPRHGSVTTAGR